MKRKLLWILAAGVVVGITLSGLCRHFTSGQTKESTLPEIPADAVLLSLDWTQTGGESADACFFFRLERSGDAYTLSDGEESVLMTADQWRQVEETLRTGESYAPVQLPEGVEVLDATESTLTVTWQWTDSKTITAVYDGSYEAELRQLLFGFLTAEP